MATPSRIEKVEVISENQISYVFLDYFLGLNQAISKFQFYQKNEDNQFLEIRYWQGQLHFGGGQK